MWQRDESGVIEFICDKCGRVYDMSNEWDRANLDSHECNMDF